MTDINILKRFQVFDDYIFDEKPHIYTYKGEIVGTSGSQLIEEYQEPFDAERIAPFTAKKLNMSADEVLDMWKTDNLISQVKGTHLHAYMENLTANKLYRYPEAEIRNNFGYDVLEEYWFPITIMMEDFKEYAREFLIPIRSELIIGDPEFDIAGAVDQIYYNTQTEELEVWDWKTNKEIKYEGYKHKKLLGILSDLEDCNYVHYSIQLNIYKYILQKMTGLKFGKCRIVWFNEKNDTYQIIDCLDLYDRAKQMLLERRDKINGLSSS